MKKARITYRFDRGPQPVRGASPDSGEAREAAGAETAQESKFENVIPLVREMTERRHGGDRIDAFEEEAERIGREIRQSVSPYYTSPEADAAFERIPFYDEAPPAVYRRKSGQTGWLSAFAALIGAILTGMALGMLVLAFFRGGLGPFQETSLSGRDIDPGKSGAAETSGVPQAESAAAGESGSLANETWGGGTQVVPERTYYFVQNGVFSSREGAAAALGLLKEKGLSGAVEAGDAYSVYAGAAANRDDALLIGHHLQNEGFEVYVKPYVLPAFDAAVSGGAAEELAEYLRRSRELAGAVLEICAVRLNEARPEPLAEAEAERLKRLHQQWTEQANRLAASASSDPVQEKLNTALNSAMLTLERYDKDPVHAYLWQAQAAAADHIIAQRAFLAAPDL